MHSNIDALQMSQNNDVPQPISPKRRCIVICQNRSCLRSGSAEVLAEFQTLQLPQVFVSSSDCLGQCSSGPTVQVMPDGTWYCQVKPSDVAAIAQQHLHNDQPVTRLLHPRFHPNYDT
jgi:(2Fe-2S) ferredoxin